MSGSPDYGQETRRANRRNALGHAAGWTRHTGYHWQREVNGKTLDYWPGSRRFRYDGVTSAGDVMAFIASLQCA